MHYSMVIDLMMGLSYVCMCIGLMTIIRGRPRSYRNIGIKGWSIIQVILLGILTLFISLLIPDPELANRWLHAVGGAMVLSYGYYLAVRDTKTRMTRLQYILLGMLLVNMAGVCNELLESIIQHYSSLILTPHLTDTWLDLWSNTIGSSIVIIITSRWIHAADAPKSRSS